LVTGLYLLTGFYTGVVYVGIYRVEFSVTDHDDGVKAGDFPPANDLAGKYDFYGGTGASVDVDAAVLNFHRWHDRSLRGSRG